MAFEQAALLVVPGKRRRPKMETCTVPAVALRAAGEALMREGLRLLLAGEGVVVEDRDLDALTGYLRLKADGWLAEQGGGGGGN